MEISQANRSRTTIVIPTFNRPELLKTAISSALGQTVPCEVIVVDHGSDNSTAQAVSEFGTRVRYLRRDTDYGPIFAWLEGALSAETDYVKILFDDDYLDASFIESCEHLMGPDIGFVVSQARVVDLDTGSTLTTMFDYPGWETGVFRNRSGLGRKIESAMVSPTAMLLRKSECLSAFVVGEFPFQRFTYFGAGPDHYVKLLSMLKYGKFGYLASPKAFFGAHPNSITTDALSIESSRRALRRTYREVNVFYRLLKTGRRFLPFFRLRNPLDLAKRILKQLLIYNKGQSAAG